MVTVNAVYRGRSAMANSLRHCRVSVGYVVAVYRTMRPPTCGPTLSRVQRSAARASCFARLAVVRSYRSRDRRQRRRSQRFFIDRGCAVAATEWSCEHLCAVWERHPVPGLGCTLDVRWL